MSEVAQARERVEKAQAWRQAKWAEYTRAGMRLRDAERWLAEAEHAARLADKVAA